MGIIKKKKKKKQKKKKKKKKKKKGFPPPPFSAAISAGEKIIVLHFIKKKRLRLRETNLAGSESAALCHGAVRVGALLVEVHSPPFQSCFIVGSAHIWNKET